MTSEADRVGDTVTSDYFNNYERISADQRTLNRSVGYSMSRTCSSMHTTQQHTAAMLGAAALLQHVLRLPQQEPWTGQPRRTTGLERLGFYGDT